MGLGKGNLPQVFVNSKEINAAIIICKRQYTHLHLQYTKLLVLFDFRNKVVHFSRTTVLKTDLSSLFKCWKKILPFANGIICSYHTFISAYNFFFLQNIKQFLKIVIFKYRQIGDCIVSTWQVTTCY